MLQNVIGPACVRHRSSVPMISVEPSAYSRRKCADLTEFAERADEFAKRPRTFDAILPFEKTPECGATFV